MENPIRLIAPVISSGKYSIFLIVYFVSMTIIMLLIGWFLKNPDIIPAGIILWLLPYFLERKFRKPFSKQAAITFDNNGISIQLSNLGSNVIEKTDNNLFADILSFRVMDSTKDDSSILKLKLKNGIQNKYTFLEQRKANLKNKISELTFEYINNYNDTQEEYNKIQYTPNLFAKPLGQVLIVGLTILVVISLLFQISSKPKTIPFTILPSLAFYFIIVAQRKKDVEQIGKMR